MKIVSWIVFGIAGALALLTIISFVTIYGSLDPKPDWCGSPECWESFLIWYSFPIKSFSAGVALLTIGIAIIRVRQTDKQLGKTQEQLVKMSRQIGIQEKQINLAISNQLRDDYRANFSKADLTKNFFIKIQFNFMDNMKIIMPHVDEGIPTINESIESWFNNDVRALYSAFGMPSSEDVSKFKIRHYGNLGDNILSSFSELFVTETRIDQIQYFDGEKFLCDIDNRFTGSLGGNLCSALNDVINVIDQINKYYQKAFFTTDEIIELRGPVNKVIRLNNDSLAIISQIKSLAGTLSGSATVDYSKSAIKNWFTKTRSDDEEINDLRKVLTRRYFENDKEINNYLNELLGSEYK